MVGYPVLTRLSKGDPLLMPSSDAKFLLEES